MTFDFKSWSEEMTAAPKRCRLCCQFFVPRQKKQQFCSTSCAAMNNGSKLHKWAITVSHCYRCSKEFLSCRKQHRFCSRNCADKESAGYKILRKHYCGKPCGSCGMLFVPRTKATLYCSKRCRMNAKNIRISQQENERNMITGFNRRGNPIIRRRFCIRCQCSFIAKAPNAIRCTECQRAHNRSVQDTKYDIAREAWRVFRCLEDRHCRNCQGPINDKVSSAQFCSRLCGERYRRKDHPAPTRSESCDMCGHSFIPKKGEKSCSRQCAMRSLNVRSWAAYKMAKELNLMEVTYDKS
jgi:hypothetical protein